MIDKSQEGYVLVARESKSRYALLGMLSFQPMSGYDLKKQIEQSTGYFWSEDFAQIYPMLKQLEAEGLTTSHAEKQEGRPERRIYALTEKGWETLRQWLAEPAIPQIERNELLLKMFFGSRTTIPVSIEHIQRFRALQVDLRETYEQIAVSLQQQYPLSQQLPYWLMTISYGRHIANALIDWCDETLTQLQQLSISNEEISPA